MEKLPFDFDELDKAQRKLVEEHGEVEPTFVKATDDIDLAVRVYEPPKSAIGILVLYHGGGAHSGAGYGLVARGLAQEYNIKVYTPDLRGHGKSGGPQGDSPTREQVWIDIDTMMEYVYESNKAANLPLFLGGHSSGGGVIVNYATWEDREFDTFSKLTGFVLISPQLGHLAKVDRPLQPNRKPFAKVNIPVFIANAIFGVFAHYKAVKFAYPKEILEEDPGIAPFNTVNMANAITPLDPQKQFLQIDDKTKVLPLKLWIGENDELFLADKVAAYCGEKDNMASNLSAEILPGKSHLGILVDAHKHVGPWLVSQIQP